MKLRVLLLSLTLSIACTGEKLGERGTPKLGDWEHPNTVEEGQDTDNALDLAAQALPADNRHNNTQTAFDNLKTATNNTIVLVGHGAPGVLCTGDGRTCTSAVTFDKPTSAAAANVFVGNSNVKTLRILACNLAFGPPGEKVSQAIADATGLVVLAPRSMVYCKNGHVYLENKDDWFEAAPHQARKQNTKPDHSVIPSPFLELTPGVASSRVPWNGVSVDNFSVLDSLNPKHFTPLDSALARQLLDQIDFSTSFDPGRPLGIVTGHITLSHGNTAKSYDIYANGVVQDSDNSHAFFHVGTQFTNTLSAQLR